MAATDMQAMMATAAMGTMQDLKATETTVGKRTMVGIKRSRMVTMVMAMATLMRSLMRQKSI